MSVSPRAGGLPAALTALPDLSTAQLRTEWQRLHGGDPPPLLSPDLLRRGIGYKLQEAALGSLSAASRRRLAALVDAGSAAGGVDALLTAPPAQLKPGATLLRDWHGQIHTVVVRERGFEHQGRHYASLSEAARAITGVRWSGPRFFGLQRSSRRWTSVAAEEGGDVTAS